VHFPMLFSLHPCSSARARARSGLCGASISSGTLTDRSQLTLWAWGSWTVVAIRPRFSVEPGPSVLLVIEPPFFVQPNQEAENGFITAGGHVISWREGSSLEGELFQSLSHPAISKLVEFAIEIHGEDQIDAQIRSASDGEKDLDNIRLDMLLDEFSTDVRQVLARAAGSKSGWFKTVGRMEQVARRIVAPDLANADAAFTAILESIFTWAIGERA
jgi:hypothetical protein